MNRPGKAHADMRATQRSHSSHRISEDSFVIPALPSVPGPRPNGRANGPAAPHPVDDAGRSDLEPTESALLGRVTVVIPTLNEAECIREVLLAIPPTVGEVIVVDGLSSDGTGAAALAARPDVRLMHQTVPGKGAAIRLGVEAASGDYIVFMDGDGSTDASHIAAFARTLAGGADYVKASRFLPGSGTDDMPLHRRVGNWFFVVLAKVLFGTRFTDITYGFNAVKRDHAAGMALEIDGWAQEIVTNIRMFRRGLRVQEIPAFEPRRIAGEAKLQTWSAGWDILGAMLAERRRPLAPPGQPRVEGHGGEALRQRSARPLVPVMDVPSVEGSHDALNRAPRVASMPRLVPVMDPDITHARERDVAFDDTGSSESAPGVLSVSRDS